MSDKQDQHDAAALDPQGSQSSNGGPVDGADASEMDGGTIPIWEESPDAADQQGEVPLTLEEQLLRAEEQRQEYEGKYLRAYAEMDNVRRRMQRERDDERRFAALPIVRELLPAFDNLDRAVQAAAQGSSVEDLKQGVEMVLLQAQEVLGRLHVTPIESVGQPFDPNLHEALTQIPTADVPPMTIVQEVEKGYRLHDRVIRPSKVIVSAEP